MKLAVMQPYFFPYIGYFQLANAVDLFVFFNDVNFIKRGWINRNSILNQNKPQAFTIPLVKVSQNKHINQVEIFEYPAWRQTFLKTLEFNYRRAPHFQEAFDLISKILFSKEFLMIDELAARSVIEVSGYVGLETRFRFSSELVYAGADGQEKILDICRKVEADAYINPQNGAFQYQEAVFNENHIGLYFLAPVGIEYNQFAKDQFIPWLSIVDVLMFNAREEILSMVRKNELYKGRVPDQKIQRNHS